MKPELNFSVCELYRNRTEAPSYRVQGLCVKALLFGTVCWCSTLQPPWPNHQTGSSAGGAQHCRNAKRGGWTLIYLFFWSTKFRGSRKKRSKATKGKIEAWIAKKEQWWWPWRYKEGSVHEWSVTFSGKAWKSFVLNKVQMTHERYCARQPWAVNIEILLIGLRSSCRRVFSRACPKNVLIGVSSMKAISVGLLRDISITG